MSVRKTVTRLSTILALNSWYGGISKTWLSAMTTMMVVTRTPILRLILILHPILTQRPIPIQHLTPTPLPILVLRA